MLDLLDSFKSYDMPHFWNSNPFYYHDGFREPIDYIHRNVQKPLSFLFFLKLSQNAHDCVELDVLVVRDSSIYEIDDEI